VEEFAGFEHNNPEFPQTEVQNVDFFFGNEEEEPAHDENNPFNDSKLSHATNP
jgi:hypothetical protein